MASFHPVSAEPDEKLNAVEKFAKEYFLVTIQATEDEFGQKGVFRAI